MSPIQTKELTVREDVPVPVDVVSQIVALAANADMDVAKLEKLIDMQERVMRSQAESAFNQAFSVMQGEIPTVIEKGKTDKAFYATLEDIIETVRPILTKHGFSLSHRTEWPEKGIVKVVGILAHKLGHARQSEFITPADAGPGRNAIQGLGSAMTYGRRYTTNDLLGIVTRKEDDDGKRASSPEPDGFDEWFMDIAAVSEEGYAALKAAWEKAKPEYRSYATKHYRQTVEKNQARAKAVKP